MYLKLNHAVWMCLNEAFLYKGSIESPQAFEGERNLAMRNVS